MLTLVRSLSVGIALAAGAVAGTPVIFVDVDATGAGTGLTWADAFTDLQDALDVAQAGTQIWIAEGSYFPSQRVMHVHTGTAFALPPDIALYGGFAGGEAALADRDPDAHLVVLDGNIGDPSDVEDDASPVVLLQNAGEIRLDGLTVRRGFANELGVGAHNGSGRGAGIRAWGTSLTMVDVIVRDCTAESAYGALFAPDGDVTLEGCRIVDNVEGGVGVWGDATIDACLFSGNAARGIGGALLVGGTLALSDSVFEANEAVQGGALVLASAEADVTGCTFTGNMSTALSSSSTGAGAVLCFGGAARFTDCRWVDNRTLADGGAIDSYWMAVMSFTRCTFEGNVAVRGGAIARSIRGVLRDCVFLDNRATEVGGAVWAADGSMSIVGCRFLGNRAGCSGGALALSALDTPFDVYPATVLVSLSAFTGNVASRGGAIVADTGCEAWILGSTIAGNTALQATGGLHLVQQLGFAPTVTVANSILSANVDAAGGGESAQVQRENGTLAIDATLVEGWTGQLGGAGNFDADPLFTDLAGPDGWIGTLDDDVRLSSGSPAIDEGSEALVPFDLADLDCDGDRAEPESLDLDRTARTAGDAVDLGAYERSPWVNVLSDLPGANGAPCLVGQGELGAGEAVRLTLTGARPRADVVLVLGVREAFLPFLGGVLVPSPDEMFAGLVTDAEGTLVATWPWPAAAASGFALSMQALVADPGAPQGVAFSNATTATTP